MKRFIISLAATMLIPLALVATPASARNYDCSKPGNATKAVCKNAAAAPATKQTTAAAKATKASPNYDCSKAGNANKAACKGAKAAPATTPAAAPVTAAKTSRNYDCSKPGNANKAACKSAVPAAITPAAKPAGAATSAKQGQATNGKGPEGATAKCRDNTYSHSTNRSGTCSRHGGVAQWY